jgi:hypothetical protein
MRVADLNPVIHSRTIIFQLQTAVHKAIVLVRCSLLGLTTATPDGTLFAACNSSLVQSGKLRNLSNNSHGKQP